MTTQHVLGIDLGTTNSVVAVAPDRNVRVLSDGAGRCLVPSVVSFHPSGNVLVGFEARERRIIDAKNTVYSVKRLIGRPFRSPEVREALERFPFELRESPSGGVLVAARGRTYALEEISAFVLRQVRNIATRSLGEVKRAVVTVPANFNELQRQATKAAGQIAGLDVIRILNEPTAAALAYGYGTGAKERIAIFDLGGGTFDITIMELSGDVFEVIASAGDTYLGGDDIDTSVATRMAEEFIHQHRYDPRVDSQAFERLRAAGEWAKCRLTDEKEVQLRVEELAYGPGGKRLDLDFQLTRVELERLSAPYISRCFDTCEDAMRLAGVRPTQIDNVILAGGSTRMPIIRRLVADYFGREPLAYIDPDLVVAQGAAIQGRALATGTTAYIDTEEPTARGKAKRVTLDYHDRAQATPSARPAAPEEVTNPKGTSQVQSAALVPQPGLTAPEQIPPGSLRTMLDEDAQTNARSSSIPPPDDAITETSEDEQTETGLEPPTETGQPEDTTSRLPSLDATSPPRIVHATVRTPDASTEDTTSPRPSFDATSAPRIVHATVRTPDASTEDTTSPRPSFDATSPPRIVHATVRTPDASTEDATSPRPSLDATSPPRIVHATVRTPDASTEDTTSPRPSLDATSPPRIVHATVQTPDASTEATAPVPAETAASLRHASVRLMDTSTETTKPRPIATAELDLKSQLVDFDEEDDNEETQTSVSPAGAREAASTLRMGAVPAPAPQPRPGSTLPMPAVAPTGPPARTGTTAPMPVTPEPPRQPTTPAPVAAPASRPAPATSPPLPTRPAPPPPAAPSPAAPPPLPQRSAALAPQIVDLPATKAVPIARISPTSIKVPAHLAQAAEPAPRAPIRGTMPPPLPATAPSSVRAFPDLVPGIEAFTTSEDAGEKLAVDMPQGAPRVQPVMMPVVGAMGLPGGAPSAAIAHTMSAPSVQAPVPRPPLLLDVTPHSLAIETAGGYCEKLVERNSAIPAERTEVFSTSQDGQIMVRARICQGESRVAEQNQMLGEIALAGLRPASRGEVKIAVTFIIDADGTLRVNARDLETGREQAVTIALLGALDQNQIAEAQARQQREMAGGWNQA